MLDYGLRKSIVCPKTDFALNLLPLSYWQHKEQKSYLSDSLIGFCQSSGDLVGRPDFRLSVALSQLPFLVLQFLIRNVVFNPIIQSEINKKTPFQLSRIGRLYSLKRGDNVFETIQLLANHCCFLMLNQHTYSNVQNFFQKIQIVLMLSTFTLHRQWQEI